MTTPPGQGLDPAILRALDGISSRMEALQSRVIRTEKALRTNQIKYSSVDQGTLPFIGPAGQVMYVGMQEDGGLAVTQVAAPAPPAPTAASLTPGPLALAVGWDGGFTGGSARPSDFDHIRIHSFTDMPIATADGDTDGTYLVCSDAEAATILVGDTVQLYHADGTQVDAKLHTVTSKASFAGFTNLYLDPVGPSLIIGDELRVVDISAGTLAGTLNQAGSLVLSPLATELHHVVLVAVNTSGVGSDASQVASATPGPAVEPGSITETEIADDSISTPKLQALAVTADKMAANSVTAGAVQAGAITAEKLEAFLEIVNKFIAGNPANTRMEIDSSGIVAYVSGGTTDDGTGEDAVITFRLSTADGTISVVGNIATSLDGTGWSMGVNGLRVAPGADPTYSPIGNPGSQVAWGGTDGSTAAYMEARTDNSLWIVNNLGNLLLGTGPGGWAHVVGPDGTSGNLQTDGLLLGKIPTKKVIGSRSDSSWSAVSGVYGTVVTGLNTVMMDSGDISYDPATSSMVAPYAGAYDLYGSLVWAANSSGYRYIELFNLTQQRVLVSTRDVASGSFNDQAIATVVGLAAGDKIQLRAYQVTSPAVSLGWRTSGADNSAAPSAALGMTFRGWATVAPPAQQPPPSGGGGGGGGSTGNTQTTTVVEVTATHSYQYGSVNAWRDNGDVYQGNFGYGNHWGGFFYGDGAFDFLAGKTVDKITMYLHRKSAGGTAGAVQPNLFGHTLTSVPGGAPSDVVAYGRLPGMAWGDTLTVELPVQAGQDLASGTIQGFNFRTNGDSYGIWYPHSSTADGKLTITYH